jgi:molecular chaperone HtpG
MPQLNLPRFFDDLIRKDDALVAGVRRATSQIGKWFAVSQTPLFPEFTNHDNSHVEAVLASCFDLMHVDSYEQVSANDAAVLTTAVLLHDCAMHLTVEGFLSLIQAGDEAPISELDSVGWPQLWEEFLAEARRFDGRRLTGIFGDTEPVQVPPSNPLDMTERDRKLIGEFIRRHHTRLAHEIALTGVPGPRGKRLPITDQLLPWLSDLSGLVARSHGMDLRSTFPYLERDFHMRDHNGVHAVFLMCLLRVADFVQIQAERAPNISQEISSLRSPISQGEWRVHQCIKNITTAGDDNEALFIDARPEDPATFLRVTEWLHGIQEEIDHSWAVLGEVYGRFSQERFDEFGLRLRRIRSNLDDAQAFAQTVDYIPKRVAFESADPDLLKLLVGPLYGEDAAVGIRELLQNSVDSVREIREVLSRHPELDEGARLEGRFSDADVEIVAEFEDGLPTAVQIADRGTGMSEEILLSYYLKAGASFRKSDAWRKQFEDEEGRSSVIRSGRFGVGALAAFLIGDEIEVRTRHYSVNDGLHFSASLDSDRIDIRRVEMPVGTTIRIKVPREKQKGLAEILDDENPWARGEWDYYCLEDPKVVRLTLELNSKNAQEPSFVKQKYWVPAPNAESDRAWRRLDAPGFDSVHWSFQRGAPGIVCNGIIIDHFSSHFRETNYRYRSQDWYENEAIVNMPSVSIFDADGRLPINLKRDSLIGSFPFSDVLWREVYLDFLGHTLVFGPNTPQFLQNSPDAPDRYLYPGAGGGRCELVLH